MRFNSLRLAEEQRNRLKTSVENNLFCFSSTKPDAGGNVWLSNNSPKGVTFVGRTIDSVVADESG